MLETKGQRYKIEYQENGGGSLTTSATIEYTLDKREIRKDGKPAMIRVLHIISFHSK